MSSLSQPLSHLPTNQPEGCPEKTTEDYRRNVKKLKLKLSQVQSDIATYEKKIATLANTANDKIIAMKISKCCRERRITPEMLFRFADQQNAEKIEKESLRAVLANIGVRLSQHELSRLEYLLDEDISGDISKYEYYGYLHAYEIKSEYSGDDPYLKEVLRKLDLQKLKLMAEARKENLLNYEEFLKYCHLHMPELSDKEIASIFNRLEKDGLIDLEVFAQYLQQKQEQDRKMRERNKTKVKTQKILKPVKATQLTVKIVFNQLFRSRPKHSERLFHFSEFKRVELAYERRQGELLALFRRIDKKKVGSFGYSELLEYYVETEPKDSLYAYEIMGRKMTAFQEQHESIIRQYCKANTTIAFAEFVKFMNAEFASKEGDAKKIFECLAKKETKIPIKLILEAMKLSDSEKRHVFIKPTLWGTERKDFFRKNSLTILFNPFVALRFCISIVEELQKEQLTHWDDFEFGPTLVDPQGFDSIDMELPTAEIKWVNANSLGMSEFFLPIKGKKYLSSAACPHEMFLKSLSLLVQEADQFLWWEKKLELAAKSLEEKHLKPLFEGVYPVVFHSFAKYSIYVLRFFVEEKWVYVIIDGKVPCDSESNPLFSVSTDPKQQWVSLIEKAYAKVRGSYRSMFEGETNQYIHELSRRVPVSTAMHSSPAEEEKNKIWNFLSSTKAKRQQLYALAADSDRLCIGKSETGIVHNAPYKVEEVVEVRDSECHNSHKSHRLVIMGGRTLANQDKWNPNWHQGNSNNKFQQFEVRIDASLKAKNSRVEILKESNLTLMNFKLFRSVFTSLLLMEKPDFDHCIVLRKTIEFEEKFKCKYELSSAEEASMIITFNQLQTPESTAINIVLSDLQSRTVLHSSQVRHKFEAVLLPLPKQLCCLEIWVDNWLSKQEYTSSLTFYLENPRFHLRELDRHLLFRHVSPYEESKKLSMESCEEKERAFIYKAFYKSAERTRGCC